MKSKIQQRLNNLTVEIDNLHTERQALSQRDNEIQVRMHQLVGAIYELQQLIVDLDHQPFASHAVSAWDHQSTHPSEGVDLDNHQVQLTETEKNSQQQS